MTAKEGWDNSTKWDVADVVNGLHGQEPIESVLIHFGFVNFRRALGSNRLVATNPHYIGNSGERTHRRTDAGWIVWIAAMLGEAALAYQARLHRIKSITEEV